MLTVSPTPVMLRLQHCLVATLLTLGMLCSDVAEAQSGSAKSVRPKRSLVLEVLIQPSPIYRVRAQEWGRELQELGYAPRFREPVAGEKMRIEQQLKDGRDVVFIVGGLTRDGGLTLGNTTFALADMKELNRFLDDMRTHGPGGAPAGNPRWGLTEQQFQDFVRLVSEPADSDVSLGSAAATVGSLKLPEQLAVVFAEEAFQASLQPRPETAPESLKLQGLTKGTALAVVLAQYGMGYRPIVGRGDRYTVEIVMGDESSNLWPTGWKTAESTADVLPAWLKSIPFDVEDADVASIAQAVADKLEGWIKDVRALAQDLLDKGAPVPGYKLVPKRPTRQWVNELKALEALESLAPAEELIEMRSPAQVEKVLKKHKVTMPEGLIVAVSSGNTLAPESDPRPAVLTIGNDIRRAFSKLEVK